MWLQVTFYITTVCGNLALLLLFFPPLSATVLTSLIIPQIQLSFIFLFLSWLNHFTLWVILLPALYSAETENLQKEYQEATISCAYFLKDFNISVIKIPYNTLK